MIAATDILKRVARLERSLAAKKIDAFLVTHAVNVRYLSGFEGHDSLLFIGRNKRRLITDSRYIEDATHRIKGFDVELARGSISETIRDICKEERLGTIGFEALHMPYEHASRLMGMLGGIKLLPCIRFIEHLRMVKDRTECLSVRASIDVVREVMSGAVAGVNFGVTERALCSEIEMAFIRHGARAGFDLIVATGRNASKPHATPSNARIARDSLTMIDIGCVLDGYHSDMTRMVMLGRGNASLRKAHEVVRHAQDKALQAIRPGIKAAAVDRVARSVISKAGYGKYFNHALGHGVGLEVHEGPNISEQSSDVLEPGMIFTVEPAIYMPRVGGVRIEDMVVVTKNGCEVLTR